MDSTAMFNLTSGLYIIGAKDGSKNAGCVVNTVVQATANPITLSVWINKNNHTNACIKAGKAFSVSILSEKARETLFGTFGFNSSRDMDKFAQCEHGFTPTGLPYVREGATGWLQCDVIDSVDNFTHTVFIAKVTEAENLAKETPMSYAYYHSVVKGKTPKSASSYAAERPEAEAEKGYVCSVCGYVFPGGKAEFDALPASYTCPICAVPKSKFVIK